MEDESEGNEEGLATAAAASASGGWTTTTYQGQELSNVVHIIVPDLSCIPPGGPSNAMTTALTGVHHSSISHVKDPLSALAAAAELEQVRSDMHAVEQMMENKYSNINVEHLEMRTGNHQHQHEQQQQQILLQGPHDIHQNINMQMPMDVQVKHRAMKHLPLASFLNPGDPDVQFYNEVYHYLRSRTYPEGATDVFKKIIKKRSTNYFVNEEGRLSYNPKAPKEVITSVEEQRNIIEDAHVDIDTGVHLGVKKMYSSIFSKYYWRTIYVDVGYYCRHCEKCTEIPAVSVDVPKLPESRLYNEEVLSEEITRVTTLPTDRIIRVWKKIEVKIYGPYEPTLLGNEVLITLVDPFSKWVMAMPSSTVNVERQTANFIFDSFCQFGFAQSQVVGMSSDQFETMHSYYKERVEHVQDILRSLVPFDSEEAEQSFLFTLQEESHECSWAGEMFESFCSENPSNWDIAISSFLFQYKTNSNSNEGMTPFTLMFGRNPTGYVSDEEKENINILEEETSLEIPTKRRRLQSSTLQCRHCHETFTSKISFRIHQRKHTEEARRRGTLDGEEPLRPLLQEKPKPPPRRVPQRKKRRPFGRGPERLLTLASSEWTDQQKEIVPNDESRHQLTQNTVVAVKALLNATKDERSKRGKYIKYSPELRDEIAQYALINGNHEATVYWSDRLGGAVSESTIRNFIKTYKSYTTQVKEEIGKFAFHYGIDGASKHFAEKLGHEVRKGLIKKFKKMYLKKFPEISEVVSGDIQVDGTMRGADRLSGKRVNMALTVGATRQKRSFSIHMKDEIGRYTNQFGISAAIQHFSEKLQFPLKESTVRKFKKQYIDRVGGNITDGSAGGALVGTVSGVSTVLNDPHVSAAVNAAAAAAVSVATSTTQPQTIDVLHPSLAVLNASPTTTSTVNVTTPNNFVYQHAYPLNMTGVSHSGVVSMNHAGSLQFHQATGGTAHIINHIGSNSTALSYQQAGGSGGPPISSVIMNQSFPAQQNNPGFQQGYATTAFAQTTTPPGIPVSQVTHPQQVQHGGVGVTVSGSSTMIVPPQSSPPIVVAQLTHPQHCIATTTLQTLNGPGCFDGSSLQNHNATSEGSGSLNSEPLGLMKDHSGDPGATLHTDHSDSTTTHHASLNTMQQQHGIQQLASHEDDTSAIGQSDQQENILGLDADEDYSDPPSPHKKRIRGTKRRPKKGVGVSKRGNYASYSPEVRADIGKYAAEHGNLAAVQHFKELLGFEIPESTVRGLKDKYLIKRVRGKKEVSSIGFAQRGRPMRLGKYDEIVQDCIRELVKEGEKVSSFLAIATAKQVLMQYEPSLLEEYGGHVKLNPTWAKSFLKRIGLHQLA